MRSDSLMRAMASGLGITILPRSAIGASHYKGGVLERRPLTPEPPTRTVAIAWRGSFSRPKVIDALVDAVNIPYAMSAKASCVDEEEECSEHA